MSSMVKPHKRLARTLDMNQLHGRACMNAMHKRLLASALAAAVCLSTPVVAQEPPPPAAEMTELQWQLLEKQISDRANETANSQKFFEGRPAPYRREDKDRSAIQRALPGNRQEL